MRQRPDFVTYYRKKKIYTYLLKEMKSVLEKYDEHNRFGLENHEWNRQGRL